jgi:hypothetical protein
VILFMSSLDTEAKPNEVSFNLYIHHGHIMTQLFLRKFGLAPTVYNIISMVWNIPYCMGLGIEETLLIL